MGLLKDYVSQTRRPEGLMGKMMLAGMNSGHAKLADWGLVHLPAADPQKIVDLGCGGGRNVGELLKRFPKSTVFGIDYSSLSVEKAKNYNRKLIAAASRKFEKIIDGMKTYTVEEIKEALKAAGFSAVKISHHTSKPWITVIARK